MVFMNALHSAESNRHVWRGVVLFTVAFWLSCSVLLDFVIMPGLYAGGMLTQPGFAATGYSLFWVFNRIEVLCAAIALTGVLALSLHLHERRDRLMLGLSGVMLAIALTYTYVLAPSMSALGLQLDLFASPIPIPATMTIMQSSYWGLEVLKLLVGSVLLGLLHQAERQDCST